MGDRPHLRLILILSHKLELFLIRFIPLAWWQYHDTSDEIEDRHGQ